MSLFLVDAHSDTLSKIVDKEIFIPEKLKDNHLDLSRLKQGGVKLQIFAMFTKPTEIGTYGLFKVLKMSQILYNTEQVNNTFKFVQSQKDIEYLKREKNVIGGMLSIEGASPLCGDILILESLYRLGIRIIGLTWNHRNEVADGIMVSEPQYGLTNFGREVIKKMNELGIVIDLSHIAPAGFYDTIEISKHPVIVSHANAKSVYDHPRNLDDTQLKTLAEIDGVVGICFTPLFLNDKLNIILNKNSLKSIPSSITDKKYADIDDVIRHIDYIVEKIGINHVGIGSDFDGINILPEGLEDCSKFPKLFEALSKRGYTKKDITKIAGENWLRVFKKVLKRG